MSKDNITQFPERKIPDVLIGKFETYKVVVDGKVIPRLTGYYEGDKVCLVVDGRFVTPPLEKGLAVSISWVIANALAVGEGYSHCGAESKDKPFAPMAMRIEKE